MLSLDVQTFFTVVPSSDSVFTCHVLAILEGDYFDDCVLLTFSHSSVLLRTSLDWRDGPS